MKVSIQFDLSNPVDRESYILWLNAQRYSDAIAHMREYFDEEKNTNAINILDDFMICYQDKIPGYKN